MVGVESHGVPRAKSSNGWRQMSHFRRIYVIRSRSLDCPRVFQPSTFVAGTRSVDEESAKTEIRVMEGFLLFIHNISWPTLAGVGIGAYVRMLRRPTGHPAS